MNSNVAAVFAHWENRPNPYSLGSKQTVEAENRYESVVKQGRETWRSRFQNKLGPPPNERWKRRQRNRYQEKDYPANSEGSNLADNLIRFKSGSSGQPYLPSQPSTTCICQCRHTVKNQFWNSKYDFFRVADLMNINRYYRNSNFVVRHCNYFLFACQRTIEHKYMKSVKSVKQHPRVLTAITDVTSSDEGKSMQQAKSEVFEILDRMRAKMSKFLLGIVGWSLLKLLPLIFDAIHIHKGQVAQLKAMSQRKACPLILLPNHLSHLDYLIMTLTLWMHDIAAPYVAAGDNLSPGFRGWLLRRLGAFYIRRPGRSENAQDSVYESILHTYTQELLARGQNLEVFIEGGRSRTGKVYMPKPGLLSLVVDTFYEGLVSDCYLVPVSLSYERVPDWNHARELKTGDTSSGTWLGLFWRLMTRKFGTCHITFGHPFSLQELLSTGTMKHSMSSNSLTNSRSSMTDCRFGFSASRMGVVSSIGIHVASDLTKNKAVLPSQCVAFSLLYSHQQGADVETLTRSLDLLKSMAHAKQCALGFSGSDEDVVRHGLSVLQPDLVSVNKRLLYSITSNGECRLELMSIANGLVATFSSEAVLACAILAECKQLHIETSLSQSAHISSSLYTTSYNRELEELEEICFCSETAVQRALDLCDLLEIEFVFETPCEAASAAMMIAVNALAYSGAIAYIEAPEADDEYYRNVSRKTRFYNGDDEDSDYVRTTPDYTVEWGSSSCRELLLSLRACLGPILEMYWTAVVVAIDLQDGASVTDTEMVEMIMHKAEHRLKDGVAIHDYANFVTARNAVRWLNRRNLISSAEERTEKLLEVLELIEQYL